MGHLNAVVCPCNRMHQEPRADRVAVQKTAPPIGHAPGHQAMPLTVNRTIEQPCQFAAQYQMKYFVSCCMSKK